MAYYAKLIGEKCYLSPINMEDAELWAMWHNDLEVAIYNGHEAYTPIPADKQREMMANLIQYQEHAFNIIDLTTDRPIGYCFVYDISHIDRTAQLSMTIGDKAYWNKGYGYDALNLLLDHAFNLLNLNNIMVRVYSFNERALSCYKKAGFKEFGRRRQARIIGNNIYDMVFMDILASEYKSAYVERFLR
ncbi:MAG TPA: GNAT family protein [Syntrophorhabdaceae bacterium]|nr:GNAT family protein [Syntrophorhabdaceae bacterium]HQH44178.1 GNAT family protein [Syntrophorhabdaceae bacterium]